MPRPRLSPSQRRDELRVLLRAGWQTVGDVMERLDVSRATAFRMLKELADTDPIESDTIDGHAAWRLPHGAREHPLRVTTSEMIALALVKNALGFLAGTGIKEDLDEVFARLSHAFKTSDYAHWTNLDRKLYDVNEAAYEYGEKLDVVNDVITALLREERLECRLDDGRAVLVDPYTLVLYKKGLYLLGYSHAHAEIRRFGLDRIEDAARRVGERFAYPAGFDPARAMRGPFGIIAGPRETVVIRFDASVRRYVRRRRWHESQRFRDVDGGIELTMECDGTAEIESWVLSFGDKAEVIAPDALRARVGAALRAGAARYGG